MKYPFSIRLRTAYVIGKENREKLRLQIWQKRQQSKRAQAKFGVSYSVFDGEYLLEPNIRAIRSEVDYVNVVYQLRSWYGNLADENLLPYLQDLKAKGLIDELIEYVPNLQQSAGLQELNKRNLGLKAAAKSGVTYFMTMDVDEFYHAAEMKQAQDFILEHDIDCSFVSFSNYGPSPMDLSLSPAGCYMPFFAKINSRSKLGKNHHIPCVIDKTRRMKHRFGCKYYVLSGISAHHMTTVRKDLQQKYINSSTQTTKYARHSHVPAGKVKVDDAFGILPYLQ